MDQGLTISTNAAKVMRKFERLPKAVQKEVRAGLGRGLILAEQRVRTNTWVKSRRGGAGLMGRLTSYVVPHQAMGLDGAIGFRKTRGFPYEIAQEFGARAKPGKAMAIPVSSEAKRVDSPRDMEDLFIPTGTHVLARQTKGEKFTVHWVLVKSIPARLRFRESVVGSLNEIGEQVIAGYQRGVSHA